METHAPRERFDSDGFWKDLIKRFFEPFLRLALPELHKAAKLMEMSLIAHFTKLSLEEIEELRR